MKTEDNPGGKHQEKLEQIYRLLKHDFPRLVAEAAPDFFGASKNSVSKETDFRTEMRTIRTPTLILQGDIDKSASLELNSPPSHELIADSRLMVYENGRQ